MLLEEETAKQFLSETPGVEAPTAERVAAYAKATPLYLLFIAPLCVGALAPVYLGFCAVRRLLRSSEQYRAPGMVAFVCCILCSAALVFYGIAPHPWRWPLFALAGLLIIAGFFPGLRVTEQANRHV